MVIFGIITVIVTLNPKLQGPKYRLLRALSFVAAGMSGVAPLIHGISVFGMAQTIKKVLPYALVKAACLVSGTFLYAVSFPVLQTREEGEFNTSGSQD
ncbi:unnamed protein product [Fusarium graminearum]|nr:unnamed protein product [Fusarium graminearum]